MKKVFVTSALLLFTFHIVFAQELSLQSPEALQSSLAVFNWKKTEHNFGKIDQHTPVTADFIFTNSGTAPIIISDAKGSCGCTVPVWPKEAIAPGKTGTIKVTFNAATAGPFRKSVSIFTNNGEVQTLFIEGEVAAISN